jgi:hypothetical protein
MSAPAPAVPPPITPRELAVAALLRMARRFARTFALNAYDLLSEACLRAHTEEAEMWGDEKPSA